MTHIEHFGTGRRKNAVARVRLVPGLGNMTVNGVSFESYFQFNPSYIQVAQSPLSCLGLGTNYGVCVRTSGGGLSGQSEAIRSGLAKALCQVQPEHRVILKFEGYLARDSRVKERKKYGLKKARKAPQFSKR